MRRLFRVRQEQLDPLSELDEPLSEELHEEPQSEEPQSEDPQDDPPSEELLHEPESFDQVLLSQVEPYGPDERRL